MAADLQPDSVLRPTSWCVVREQQDRYLIYNRRTDELHLVPPLGIYIYRLCDGLKTVGDIQQLFSGAGANRDRYTKDHLGQYLAALVDRGVLEVGS